MPRNGRVAWEGLVRHDGETGAGAGLAFALAGFALLSVGDAVIKSMAGAWPGTAVAALRFTIGAAGLAVLLWVREGPAGFAIARPGIQLARGVCLAFSSLCFFLAIYIMPLAEAVTISFITPMVAAALSALLMRERPPASIWVASLLAFGGVVLVLRPNLGELGWVAVLPLVSAVIFALMIVLNRMAAGAGSVIAMQFAMSVVAAPILVLAAIAGHLSGAADLRLGWPGWTVVARCAFVAISATTAHSLIFIATTRAPAGAIAPMTYVQLLVAMAIGVVVYADYPDGPALAGAALVVAGGLYLWWRDGRSPRR